MDALIAKEVQIMIAVDGVKMPTNCHECDFIGISDLVGIKCPCRLNDCYDYNRRPAGCPLYECAGMHRDFVSTYTKADSISAVIKCYVAKALGGNVVTPLGRIVLLPKDYALLATITGNADLLE